MGIGKGPAILLMKEARRKKFSGSLLTLGKQELLVSPYQLISYSKAANYPLKMPLFPDPYAPMLDKDFFSSLGFSEIHSLDYSDFEGASIPFDLNSGATPEKYKEAFDVIYDGGTIEHIFHLPNAFKSLIWMLKPGGRIIHLSPASNHLEHSFYMFSPTLFSDFYKANRFEVNCVELIRCTPCFDYRYDVYNYDFKQWSQTDIGMGRLDHGMYLVHTIATKTAESTSNAIPNQSVYSDNLWNRPKISNAAPLLSRILNEARYRKWKQVFKKSPFYNLWAFCKLKFRKQKIPFEPIDRF